MICDYEGFKLAKLAQLRRLAETSNFQTAAEFRRLAKTIIDPIEMPEIHGDWYCYEIDQAARSAPNDALPKDRGIYMLTGDDYSWGRVGEGVLGERPLCSQIAYLIDSTDFAARRRQNGRSFWSITKSLVEAIDSNGGRVRWYVIADNLSKPQAQYGQTAVMELMGLRRFGGFLINETWS